MATYNGVYTKHAQLAPSTVDTVTLNADYKAVEVVNRSGDFEIFFTVDGPAPTVAGDDTHVLPAAISGLTVNAGLSQGDPTFVKLISAGAAQYTVRGV